MISFISQVPGAIIARCLSSTMLVQQSTCGTDTDMDTYMDYDMGTDTEAKRNTDTSVDTSIRHHTQTHKESQLASTCRNRASFLNETMLALRVPTFLIS